MRQPEAQTSLVRSKRMAAGHLLGFVIALVVFAVALVPATPLFVRLMLPFPKLHDASHWSGRVEVEGQFAIGTRSNILPRQFIVASDGRHEFKCGFVGYRIPCSNYQALDGAIGEVWYHPIFGALQWRFEITRGNLKGRIEERTIEVREASFREDFNFERYIGKLLISLAALSVAAWQYVQYKRHRAAAAAAAATQGIQQANSTNSEA